MRKILLGAVVLFSLIFIQGVYATTDTVGDTSGHAAGQSANGDIIYLVASASGVLQTVGLNLYAADGVIRVAIYDNTTRPNQALLGESASVTAAVGWNDIAMPSINIVAGTAYWLGLKVNSSTTSIYFKSGTSNADWRGYAYGPFPNPFGGATGQVNFNMRMIYAPGDTTAPTYSLNSTNSTLIGTFISHNLYWNDDTALHTKGQYRAWFDNCTGVFANVTPLTNFTATPQWTNFTVKINTTAGCTIRWFVNATDNVGNLNNTGTTTPFSYVTTSPPDTTAPTYALNSTNSTLKGTPIQFSLNWTDETALSMAITGLWNGSAWTNATSWCDLSSATWCNQTLVVNFTAQQLWWRGYANDTADNWNASENFSLITTSPPKDKIAPSILAGILEQFLPDVMAMEPTFQQCYNNTHLLVNKDLTLEYDANESVITQTYYRYCEHGCDNTTDTCSPMSAFNLNFLIIGAFLVTWIVLGIFYYFIRRMPVIKHFMWFFVIIGMVVLLFYAPYPTYLTAQQLDIAQIFTIITLLSSVAMFVLG